GGYIPMGSAPPSGSRSAWPLHHSGHLLLLLLSSPQMRSVADTADGLVHPLAANVLELTSARSLGAPGNDCEAPWSRGRVRVGQEISRPRCSAQPSTRTHSEVPSDRSKLRRVPTPGASASRVISGKPETRRSFYSYHSYQLVRYVLPAVHNPVRKC